MLIDKLLNYGTDLEWYDKKAFGFPLFESNSEIVLSCKDFEDNTSHNIFYPIVRKGECTNIIADFLPADGFIKNMCFAGAHGISRNIQWNKNVPTNMLLCRYDKQEYFTSEEKGIYENINVAEMQWDNSGNASIDRLLDDTEEVIREHDFSLLVCNDLYGMYYAIDTTHTLRRLEDIAEKYNIAIVAFWNYSYRIQDLDLKALFNHAHNLCFLSSLRLENMHNDKGENVYLHVFEFGGIQSPKVQYYILNELEELAISNEINQFIRYRNMYAICAPDNEYLLTDKLSERIKGKTKMQYANNTIRRCNSGAKERLILDSVPNGKRTKYRYNPECEYFLKAKL